LVIYVSPFAKTGDHQQTKSNDKWWIQLEVQLLKLVVKSKLR
jgi:hypothetical protein